jgi:phage shock protein A
MTRLYMATTATKSIAARLPFEEYVRVLNQATEAKLTVSDYLILKLSASDRVAQAEAQQVALIQQVRQLQQEVRQLHQEAEQEATQAEAQRLDLHRDMKQLEMQADTNQKNQRSALEKGRLQLEKITQTAVDWQTYANNLLQAKTVLEQTIKTHEQTLTQQKDQLAQLKAQNAILAAENQKLQRESSAVKADLADFKQRAVALWEDLAALNNNQLFGSRIADRYWSILDAFNTWVLARP